MCPSIYYSIPSRLIKNDKTYSVFECLYELVVMLFFIDVQLMHHFTF